MFGAWCVRPRVGGQVSTPLDWDELDAVDPEALTMAEVPAELAAEGDPWAGMDDAPQSIEPLLDWYQRDLDDGLHGRPVAARLPQAAPRASPGGAQPGPQGGVGALPSDHPLRSTRCGGCGTLVGCGPGQEVSACP